MRCIRSMFAIAVRLLASRTAFELALLLMALILTPLARLSAAGRGGPHIETEAMLVTLVALPATVITILSAIAVIIVPIISVPVNKLILNLNATIDGLPAWVKQIVVGIVTTLLTLAAQHVPGVPTSLQGFDVTAIGSLLNTGIAFLLHLAQAQPTPSAPTASKAIASPGAPAK